MIKRIYFISLCLFIPIVVEAQQKLLSLQDVVVGNYYYFRPDDYDQISWIDDEETFTFEKENDLYIQKVNEKDPVVALTLDQLNTIIKKQGIEDRTYWPTITWHNDHMISYLDQNDNLLYIDFSSNVMNITRKVVLPGGTENHEFSPDKKFLAFTQGNNLQILNEKDEVIAVTYDENKGIVNGKTVHRNEFGIEKGTFWSPKSNYLAFYRKDETMVTDYPLVNVNSRIASLLITKYPMAGMTSHEVTLAVYSIADGKTVVIETGAPSDQYLTNISWSPDEKYIFIMVLNRAQNHMKLNQYDAHSGQFIKTLFEEKHDKYVEPLHPLYFLPGKPDQFIYQSRRDGYNHLYLYNTNGSLIRQLTKGEWEVTGLLQADSDGSEIFFISTKENPVERHIYKTDMNNGEIKKLSKDAGVHDAYVSTDGKYIIDCFSSMKNANQINLINTEGKMVKKLVSSDNPLADYSLGEVKLGTLLADDGETELYYKLFLPPDFDAEKKYPAIVYVYGGPHAQMVLNSWYDPTELWMEYMAQRGYIVFTMDNRGSEARGMEFESCTFRRLGQIEMKDQIKGVEYLKSLGYVDEKRIGLHGWSYGGYMTISLMLNYPEVFKAGVAGGPVIDWKYYEVMYGERYMDTPEENPDGYELTNVNNKVENLQGRLLIIHGAMDSTVVWQHSLSFVNACVENGKLIDYFVYPNHAHNVRGMDRIHMWWKITQYFIDFL
ncbi:MAG: S9 family peptidase [Bacteroidales bacterium]|nr:S9 family peptidase [Bacteroidales bacterium]